MPLTNIEWVFFDLGDTLVDNTRAWLQRLDDLRAALAEIGMQHSLEELSGLFEQVSADHAKHPFSELQRRLGLNEAQQKFTRQRCNWQHDLEEPIPGAKDLLAALHGHYKMGVIANQSPGSAERCKQWGMANYFDQFLASAELGASKPDPRIFHMALERAQCPPERAVMVGDRIDNDIRPARLVGMKTVRLLRGYQRLQQPRDEWERADFTANTLEEVRSFLMG